MVERVPSRRSSRCLKAGTSSPSWLFDVEGNVESDSIALDYSEPSEGPPVTIISPKDGQVFDVSERSVVSVKGTVGDQDVKRATLIFNGNPIDISVNRGYFEQKVALVQEQNTVLVEAASAGGGVSRSKLINLNGEREAQGYHADTHVDKPHATGHSCLRPLGHTHTRPQHI
jgi:hypothetical protein